MDHLQLSSRFRLDHVSRGPSDTSQSLLRGEAKRREVFYSRRRTSDDE